MAVPPGASSGAAHIGHLKEVGIGYPFLEEFSALMQIRAMGHYSLEQYATMDGDAGALLPWANMLG